MIRTRSWLSVGVVAVAIALGGCERLEEWAKELPGKSTPHEQKKAEKKSSGSTGARAGRKPAGPPREREATKPSSQGEEARTSYYEDQNEGQPPEGSYRHEWYVSPKGSDSAEGTREAPFRTIRKGLAAARPGDAIRVQAGEYAENVVIDGAVRGGSKGAPITLLGEGKPRIVPGREGGALLQVRRPYWHIRGLEVDVRGQPRFAALFQGNTEGAVLAGCHLHHGSLGGGVTTFGGARGVTLEDNHIHDFRKPADDSHGVVIQATSRDIVLRRNDIHDDSGDAVQCLKPDSAAQEPARGVLIEDNHLHDTGENAVDIKTCRDVVVRRNRMHGFHKSASSGGEAVVVHYSASNVRIENNDISNAGKGIAVGGVKDGGRPDPSNVVLRDNRIRDISSKGGGDGVGIRVENAQDVVVRDNRIEDTDGYGMMLGLGANGAPSKNLEVASNEVRSEKLVRVGPKRPGLRMDDNRYATGGLFKADPLETRDFSRWKSATGLDGESVVK